MLACPDLTSSLYHSRRTLSLPSCPRSLISALYRPRVLTPARRILCLRSRRILCLRSLYKSPVTARPEFSHSVYISLCPVSIPLCTLLSLLSFPMHHLSRCALSLAAPGTSVSAHGPLHMLNLVARTFRVILLCVSAYTRHRNPPIVSAHGPLHMSPLDVSVFLLCVIP